MYRLLFLIKTNWVAAMLVTLSAITVLSLWPLSQLPPAPGSDKAHHVLAYAFLMLPVALRKPAGWMVLGLFFILYSGAIELLQPLVNRHGEWWDLLANTAGVMLGALVAVLINRLFPAANSKL
ncbi:MAG TPA: VanZ family protein [Burkholderiales bacterium]|nr:VanZ family protein [Burkholderiales bacterium]